MAIDHVLAVAPVTDLHQAAQWYELLLGRPADNRPMDTLAEWRVTETGWLQVFRDPERSGSGLVNFAVGDLERHLEALAGRGIELDGIQEADQGVRLASVTDPAGNTITFIGGFRIAS